MKIELSTLFGDSINSRSAIENAVSSLTDNSFNELDFKNIEFISRSAAHQLIIEKIKYPTLKFSNVDSSVQKMLDIVNKTYSKEEYDIN